MINGYCSEPINMWSMFRGVFEKRRWIKRRTILSDSYPTMTRGIRTPDQMYFYGTPEVYVKSGRTYSGPEIVRGVANLDKRTGLIWYSRPKARHHNLLWVMGEYGVDSHGLAESIQGFLTSKGRFLTREEAMVMAVENYQLIGPATHQTKLFSEDLFSGPLGSSESFESTQRTHCEHSSPE